MNQRSADPSDSGPTTLYQWLRRRPGMYIGGTDEAGLHNLMGSALDYPLAEAEVQRLERVELRIRSLNAIEIRVVLREPLGQPMLDKLRTVASLAVSSDIGILHTWAEHIALVSAASDRLIMKTLPEANGWRQEFNQGQPGPGEDGAQAAASLQLVFEFVPASDLFEQGAEIAFDALAAMLNNLALLNAGVVFKLADERLEPALEATFIYPQGVLSYLRQLLYRERLFSRMSARTVFAPSGEISIAEGYGKARIEIAFAYRGVADPPAIMSFAGNMPIRKGGAHLDGFLFGLERFLLEYARNHALVSGTIEHLNVRPGLMALINVQYRHVNFTSHVTTALINPELLQPISDFIYNYLKEVEAAQDEALREIVQRLLHQGGAP